MIRVDAIEAPPAAVGADAPLRALPRAFPVLGFGGGDCRVRPAHLLRAPDHFGAKELARGMPPSVLYVRRERQRA